MLSLCGCPHLLTDIWVDFMKKRRVNISPQNQKKKFYKNYIYVFKMTFALQTIVNVTYYTYEMF